MGKSSIDIQEMRDMLDPWLQEVAVKIEAGNTSVVELIETMRRLDVNVTDEHRSTRSHIVQQLGLTEQKTMCHVANEHRTTRGHIDDGLKSINLNQTLAAELKSFLDTLYFPEIRQRQQSIPDAHKKTFEWIFDDAAHEGKPWSNFREWARSDEHVYWVLGKPGSGKSTLMNFLVSDPRTRAAFESKNNDPPPMLLSFFFWEAGSDLQKNKIGLLRSLIWQLFSCLDESMRLRCFTDIVRPNVPGPVAWTHRQLLSLLQSLLQNITIPLALFLDGLDEFKDVDDEFDAIDEMLRVFRTMRYAKLCISSRPATVLQQFYARCPKLRLQDLTKSDITIFVKDMLAEASSRLSPQLEEVTKLANEVVWRAEGVFLWVKLAVQSLIRGIRNEDKWSDLTARLGQMPPGIFDLYTHIWKRIEIDKPIYAKEAATYLQLLRDFEGRTSILQLLAASDAELQRTYLNDGAFWDLERHGQDIDPGRFKKRLLACCGTFLDIQDSLEYRLNPTAEDLSTAMLESSVFRRFPTTFHRLEHLRNTHYKSRVSFMHRTALEYLETPAGRELLAQESLSRRSLAEMKLRSFLLLIGLLVISPDMHALHLRIPMLLGEVTRYDVLLKVEAMVNKILSMNICNLHDLRESSSWMFYEDSDEVDFTKSLIGSADGAYLRQKLEITGLISNATYLTDTLRLLVTFNFSDVEERDEPRVLDLFRLLLESPADPNARFLSARQNTRFEMPSQLSRDLTIWQQFLMKAQFGHAPFKETIKRQIKDLFMRANADCKTPIVFLFVRNGGNFFEVENAALTRQQLKGLILDKLSYDLSPTNPTVGRWLKCGRALPVQFLPPDSWRVVPGLVTKIYWYHGDFAVAPSGRDARNGSETFSCGREALNSAGWTDKDMERLPISKALLYGKYDEKSRAHVLKVDGGSLVLRHPETSNVVDPYYEPSLQDGREVEEDINEEFVPDHDPGEGTKDVDLEWRDMLGNILTSNTNK